MALTPHCEQPEWTRRAAVALSELLPDKTAAEIAAIIAGHLWEHACDMSPEEAAESFVVTGGEGQHLE